MRFGTDGIRGLANAELTPELALSIGRAAAAKLPGDRFFVARDPRHSASMIESALAAGMASGGANVELVGEMPTPALAKLSADDNVPAAMISASHNPAADNGIKLFAAGGRKLTDQMQADIEAFMAGAGADGPSPTGAEVGVITTSAGAGEGYIDAVVASVADVDFPSDLRVVIDCANGAASAFAAPIAARLGIDAIIINDSPDGLNINDRCGSTHLDVVADAVRVNGAAFGLSLDGDADRVLGVTSDGTDVDGDQIMAMLAIDLHAQGRLVDDSVVVTVMTNLGFRLAMAERGINVVETPVGDRHVLEALADKGLTLGGEQSGHIILPDLATTGDGLLTAAQVMSLVVRDGRSLGELADDAMSRLPQVLVNVKVEGNAAERLSGVVDVVEAVERELGNDGRVLVRPSGTEPVIRVMVEARNPDAAQTAVDRIVTALS